MAITCDTKLGADILNDCTTQPTGGLEVEAYLINRTDIATITRTGSLVSAITLNTGAKAYKLTGVNKNFNGGSELSKVPELANTYIHKFMFKGFQMDSASNENMDNMNDMVVIYQRKDQDVNIDGVFNILGLRCGLYVNVDTFNTNELNGVRNIEMQSEEQQTEPYSKVAFLDTDIPTSKAALEALLTPAV